MRASGDVANLAMTSLMVATFPECGAHLTWEKLGIRFSLARVVRPTFSMLELQCGFQRAWFCGYCRFPMKPVIENGYSGILEFVPTHGGITFAERDSDGSMVYGFDCNHAEDGTKPELRDVRWLRQETERMAFGILQAAKFEEEFLLESESPEERIAVLDRFHAALRKAGIAYDLRDNGVMGMLRVLVGEI